YTAIFVEVDPGLTAKIRNVAETGILIAFNVTGSWQFKYFQIFHIAPVYGEAYGGFHRLHCSFRNTSFTK
ncbi:MAG: hypothetical protein LBL04_06125, partial [Bacteroidales bacterium]|nr:hypothetical protein [Bacteroidales bacterium]